MISVVIATYNSASTLQRCLQSLADQTYENFEVVVIDGASNDGSVEIIRRYEARLKYWESERDTGIFHAWNKAIRHTTGEWLYFLGADDYLWTPDSLSKAATLLESLSEECGLAFGRVLLVNQLGVVVGERGEAYVRESNENLHLPHQATFHRRRLFEEHGLFDETFKIAGDYEFMLRELKSRTPCSLADLPIAAMSVGGVSDRPELYLRLRKENIRAAMRHRVISSKLTANFAIARATLRQVSFRFLGPRRAQALLNSYLRLRGKRALVKHLARQDS